MGKFPCLLFFHFDTFPKMTQIQQTGPDTGAVGRQLPKNVQRQLPLQSLEPFQSAVEIAQSQVT